MIIAKLLARLGFRNVHVAENGLVATQMCAREEFDLLLMDIHVCACVRARESMCVSDRERERREKRLREMFSLQ